VRSEGECRENGGRPQDTFRLHRLDMIYTVVYLTTRTFRTARTALAHTVDTHSLSNQDHFALFPLARSLENTLAVLLQLKTLCCDSYTVLQVDLVIYDLIM